jgi:hypothetical protein
MKKKSWTLLLLKFVNYFHRKMKKKIHSSTFSRTYTHHTTLRDFTLFSNNQFSIFDVVVYSRTIMCKSATFFSTLIDYSSLNYLLKYPIIIILSFFILLFISSCIISYLYSVYFHT